MKFREPPTSICLNDDYVILRSENASFTASGACESPLNFEMSSRRFFGCLLFGRANLVFSEFLQTRKRKFLENQTNLNQQTAKKEKDEKKKNNFSLRAKMHSAGVSPAAQQRSPETPSPIDTVFFCAGRRALPRRVRKQRGRAAQPAPGNAKFCICTERKANG